MDYEPLNRFLFSSVGLPRYSTSDRLHMATVEGVQTPSYSNVAANESPGAKCVRPHFEHPQHLREQILQDEQQSGKSDGGRSRNLASKSDLNVGAREMHSIVYHRAKVCNKLNPSRKKCSIH
jgi:hypothetical protein